MRRLILFLAAAMAAFPQAPAAPKPAAAKPQRERLKEFDEGWVKLFNGKDFTNWVKVGN